MKKEELWTVIRRCRKERIEDYRKFPIFHCFHDDKENLLSHDDMEPLFMCIVFYIEDAYDIELVYTNKITDETFQTAEQMFFYLYLCPKYKYEWILLLLNLLENTSLDIILQTLNRIMVTGNLKNDKSLEDIAKKIFIRVGEKNPLHFQKFDRLTKINHEFIHGINNHNKTVDFGIK